MRPRREVSGVLLAHALPTFRYRPCREICRLQIRRDLQIIAGKPSSGRIRASHGRLSCQSTAASKPPRGCSTARTCVRQALA